MIQDFSITGIGMGTYPQVIELLYPLSAVTYQPAYHSHNLYLQIAVDVGLPGLIAWLSIALTLFYLAVQIYRSGISSQNAWLAAVGAALICSQVAVLVHGLVDAVTWGLVRPAPFLWGIWGMVLVFVFPPATQMYDKRL